MLRTDARENDFQSSITVREIAVARDPVRDRGYIVVFGDRSFDYTPEGTVKMDSPAPISLEDNVENRIVPPRYHIRGRHEVSN